MKRFQQTPGKIMVIIINRLCGESGIALWLTLAELHGIELPCSWGLFNHPPLV